MRVARLIDAGAFCALAGALLLTAGPAGASDTGISGKKLLLKGNKFVLLSKDPLIALDNEHNPSSGPASISFDDGSNTATYQLPFALWAASPTSAQYKNADAPNGPSAVKVAKIKQGLFKAVSKGNDLPVPNGPATIDVTVTLGSLNNPGGSAYCMTFSGTGDGSKFLVKDAAAAPCPPRCGNGVKDGTEQCDFLDDADCSLGCRPDCTCGTLCPTSGGDPAPCNSLDGICAVCVEHSTALGACLAAKNAGCGDGTLNDACNVALNSTECPGSCCP